MSRVKGKDTLPEVRVRKAAHAKGLRFRLHRKDLPGTPDLVFPKYKTVIFVHGCFWHRHLGCSKASIPKTRTDFWQDKFKTNVARDKSNVDELTDAGWQVFTIWECETKCSDVVALRLKEIFDDVRRSIERKQGKGDSSA